MEIYFNGGQIHDELQEEVGITSLVAVVQKLTDVATIEKKTPYVVQGRPRSSSLSPIERAYATISGQ